MILSGKLPAAELTGKRLQDTMDLCVECKACKAECPSNVDMAKLKAETMSKYYEERGVPLRARMFGEIAALSRVGQAAAPLTNLLSSLPPVKLLAERALGVSRRRPLPKFARRRFSSWFANRPRKRAGTRGDVVYFHDTFTEYMHPEVGQAAVRVLEALGYAVRIETRRGCCGRPLISKGQLGKAKRWARANVDVLAPHARRGSLIVGVEPSCLLTLRDEYPELLRDESSRVVAGKALMLDELIAQLAADEPDEVRAAFSLRGRPNVQVHGHCHQKAVVGMGPTMDALRAAGYEPELIDSACCGMAGTFGFEKEHYETSKAMGSLKLFPAVDAPERSGWPVVVSGVSCRQQIGHFTSKTPRHWAERLADALR